MSFMWVVERRLMSTVSPRKVGPFGSRFDLTAANVGAREPLTSVRPQATELDLPAGLEVCKRGLRMFLFRCFIELRANKRGAGGRE